MRYYEQSNFSVHNDNLHYFTIYINLCLEPWFPFISIDVLIYNNIIEYPVVSTLYLHGRMLY